MGAFGTIWDSGEAAGPILAGVLIASLSYPPAFALIAAFMAATALLFLVAVKDPAQEG
jgi:predicted MFS family arabinose efflux permease